MCFVKIARESGAELSSRVPRPEEPFLLLFVREPGTFIVGPVVKMP